MVLEWGGNLLCFEATEETKEQNIWVMKKKPLKSKKNKSEKYFVNHEKYIFITS